MHIFNPVGSEAEACGNGLRCLVKYIVDTGLANAEAQEILAETVAGIRKVKICIAMGKLGKIQGGIGEAKLGAKDIPVVIEPGLVDIKLMLSYS